MKISEDKGNVINDKIYTKIGKVNKFIRIINSHENFMEYNGETSLKNVRMKKK